LLVGVAGHVKGQQIHFVGVDVKLANVKQTIVSHLDDQGIARGWFNLDGSTNHAFRLDTSTGIYSFGDVPGSNSTIVLGANNQNQSVGFYTDAIGGHGFFHDEDPDSYSTYDDPDSFYTFLSALNDALTMVGFSIDSYFVPHGFWLENGVSTRVDVDGASGTALLGISKSTNMGTGSYYTQGTEHGFLYDRRGDTIYINLEPHFGVTIGSIVRCNGINDAGEIAATYDDGTGVTYACLLANGNMTIVHPPGAISSTARTINNQGVFGGFYVDETGVHGFIGYR
jgi:hypothetical protein